MVAVRLAAASDAAFLVDALAIAADWRHPMPRPGADVLADPHLARYVVGWPRPGDLGVVAEIDVPVGAAWWRYLAAGEPGYGFVDERIPEISIGVVAAARGAGTGSRLLATLIDCARERAVPALSLSVEPDNPAARLYRRLGFVEVGGVGGAVTMVLTLSSPPTEV